MNKKLLAAVLALATFPLLSDDSPTIDLFAGWGWSLFPYDDYPYRGGSPYWRPMPYTGVSANLYGRTASSPCSLYEGYRYGPYWGYEYGVRIALKDPFIAPAPAEGLLPPPPGSAPLELRNVHLEKTWDRDILSVMEAIDTDLWRHSATNAPAPAKSP